METEVKYYRKSEGEREREGKKNNQNQIMEWKEWKITWRSRDEEEGSG